MPNKNRLKLCLLSTYNGSRRQWILLEPYRYYHITVPAGYQTDLATVPRLLWSVLSPSEVAEAAVIHDYLYDNTHIMSKKEADKIFYNMCNNKISKFRAYLAYKAVSWFGGKNFKN